MYRSILLRGASVASLVLALIPNAQAQEPLPDIIVGAARSQRRPAAPAQETSGASASQAADARLPIYRDPPGQTVTTIDHEFLRPTPMFTVREILQYSPGVSIQDGNTSREVNISIRGSGSRFGVGFPLGVRNIVLLEDGFPITTADGTGRSDILDPHAYAATDVYRGPSSALFGNYAYGGAINFRTFSGAEIDGIETGSEFGSFGYINNFIRTGKKVATPGLGDVRHLAIWVRRPRRRPPCAQRVFRRPGAASRPLGADAQ